MQNKQEKNNPRPAPVSAVRAGIRFTAILIIFAGCCQDLMCRTDTLPKPSMTSNRLITLEYFHPEAIYGSSCAEMTGAKPPGKDRKTIGTKFILPAVFIAYGTAARFNRLPVRGLDYDIDREISKHVNRRYAADDYFEYAMPALAYGLGFIPGVNGRHSHRDRTLVMATSLIVMKGSVEALKRATAVERPEGGRRNSFPSGHTAVAMMSAHILYKEYKGTSPWIGAGGYLVATATGILRMTNRAHWASDVVMGAGIGLLSAEIGYMMLPVWHSLFGISGAGRQFTALPAIGAGSAGISLACRF
ncbi:MAG: phosphatase PAP2 family protein [Tannerella sp.]|jgi:membrane-associated phospholipid phosphatase|nr:phosphatase PAP2 family protein [Tannerella sp.]